MERNNLILDLHMHSTFSDGLKTPEEIQQLMKGHTLFAITDHDNCESAEHLASNQISGVELTARIDSVMVEVLLYGYNYNKLKYNRYVNPVRKAEYQRKIFEELKQICIANGLEIDMENKLEKNRFAHSTIYSLLCANKKNLEKLPREMMGSGEDFYRASCIKGSLFYTELNVNKTPTIDEILELKEHVGGVAILAHPMRYELDSVTKVKFDREVCKLDGIECIHPSANLLRQKALFDWITGRNMIATAGSDWHGDSEYKQPTITDVNEPKLLRAVEFLSLHK